MSYYWPDQDITLEHFGPHEFDHPKLMDTGYLQELDTLRMRCGFPLDIDDDARTEDEHRRLYAHKIAAGKPWPQDSAHLYKEGQPVRATDLKPTPPHPDDGCKLTIEERQIRLTYEITRMHVEGRWKSLGLGCETSHWHVDDTPRLGNKRPAYWVAESKA